MYPAAGQGIVLFAHGSGSSRVSPRNRMVAERLALATDWVRSGELRDMLIGYFEASTGAGAAQVAVTLTDHSIAAVVSRRGRPDLAGAALPRVRAPTLLIVGGNDSGVIELNEEAPAQLTCEKHLAIAPGAGHADQVVALARDWFVPRLHQGG